ncbi:MAG: cyclic nucleotide-binding domain-containing protein [Anaerolineae bacterium]|nr:cyclic nucleotide-binding domain-containing protein [Anaerolineae bacterium]
MHLSESKQVLRNSFLFGDLSDIHLDLILMICEEMNYQSGDIIFHQNDPGDALYIIARGEVEIILEPSEADKESVVIATLHQHQAFGETILIEERGRTAGARCHTATQLLRLERERLLTLTSDYPEIGFRIMRRMTAELISKLRAANQKIRDQTLWKSASSAKTVA